MSVIPVVGEAADLINVAIHAARGNTGAAVVSLAAAIPFLGGGVTIAKLTNKAGRAMGKHVDKIDNIGHAANDLLTNCKGASCFVAGTQVVVNVPAASVATADTNSAGAGSTLHATAALPPDTEQQQLDAWFAAVAATLGGGLLLERRRRGNQHARRTANVPVT